MRTVWFVVTGLCLLALTLRVCNGELAAAERNRCREFAINRIGPTY